MNSDTINQEIEEYNTSLRNALIAYTDGNSKLLDDHMKKHKIVNLLNIPKRTLTYKCAVYKIVTARSDLPMKVRKKAKKWLIKHGFGSWDDGDV